MEDKSIHHQSYESALHTMEAALEPILNSNQNDLLEGMDSFQRYLCCVEWLRVVMSKSRQSLL